LTAAHKSTTIARIVSSASLNLWLMVVLPPLLL